MSEPSNPIRGGSGVTRGYIGLPGSGKSTKAASDAYELARSGPFFLFVLDSTGRFLVDGDKPSRNDCIMVGGTFKRVAVRRAQTVEELRANIVDDATAVQVLFGTSAEELIAFARTVVEETGTEAIVVMDEVAFVDECDSETTFKRTLKKGLSLRRHDGIGYFWTTQYPYSVPRMMVTISERVYVGRLSDEIDLRRMREIRMPESEISKLPSMKVGEFVEVRNF